MLSIMVLLFVTCRRPNGDRREVSECQAGPCRPAPAIDVLIARRHLLSSGIAKGLGISRMKGTRLSVCRSAAYRPASWEVCSTVKKSTGLCVRESLCGWCSAERGEYSARLWYRPDRKRSIWGHTCQGVEALDEGGDFRGEESRQGRVGRNLAGARGLYRNVVELVLVVVPRSLVVMMQQGYAELQKEQQHGNYQEKLNFRSGSLPHRFPMVKLSCGAVPRPRTEARDDIHS